MTLTLNRPLGQSLKTEGMQAALDFSGPWREQVLEEFRAWIKAQKELGERVVTIEAFRSQSQTQPASHFAWGSLPAIAQSAGLIKPYFVAPGVQGRVKAASPRTHAHEVKQWSIT